MVDIEILFKKKFSEESKNMRNYLNHLRKENNFCDLTLKTKDGTLFEVHKIIMYSLSGFFQGLFDSSWKETKGNIIELDENVGSEALQFIIEYIYTGSIEKSKINFDIAVKLYAAASFLNMKILTDVVEKYMISSLSVDNSLVSWRNKVIRLSKNLNDRTIEFIKNNCTQFLNRYMLELTAEEIKNILSFHDLECSQENLLSNILKWFKNDFDKRQIFIKDFFGQIKLKELSSHYIIKNVIQDEILCTNLLLINLVANEIGSRSKNRNDIPYFANTEMNKPWVITKSTLHKIDPTLSKMIQLFVWGSQRKEGFSVTKCNGNDLFFTGPGNVCEYFRKYEFHQLPSMLEEKQYHSSVNVENRVYCCGGIGSRTMEIFDLYHMKWMQGSLMNYGRSSFGLINHDNLIYAIGGVDRNGLSSLVEKYDPRIDKWVIASVIGNHSKSSGHSKAVIHKNIIFASVSDCINQFKLNNNGLEIVKDYTIPFGYPQNAR